METDTNNANAETPQDLTTQKIGTANSNRTTLSSNLYSKSDGAILKK